jgi:glycosyltransferase involved in cell wall biosynthesis
MANAVTAPALSASGTGADSFVADGDRRDWVIMLSGSAWRVAAHRQQALARQLAGPARVLFVDPPGNRVDRRFAVRPVGPSLWRATVPSLLPAGRQVPPANGINRAFAARRLTGFLDARPGRRLLWVDEDLAAPLVGRLGETAVVYDATDLDWTFTRRWNRWHLRRSLRAAVAAADLVLASSAALPSRLPASKRPAVVLANGCDPEHFQPTGKVEPWLARLPRPRLGYLGAIDTRAFDAELVAAVARRRPEWTVVLVGPATQAGLAPLRGLSNVHIKDAVPYAKAPDLVRGFDVGIIPYRVGGLIDYVHPKKFFEYLCAGKPVVATALPALVALGAAVRTATGPEEFAAAVHSALCEPQIAAARFRAVAVANSWQVRGAILRSLLAGLGEPEVRR